MVLRLKLMINRHIHKKKNKTNLKETQLKQTSRIKMI